MKKKRSNDKQRVERIESEGTYSKLGNITKEDEESHERWLKKLADEEREESKQNSRLLLDDAYDFIKLNYKCPKGTVDDSNRCDVEQKKKN